MSAEQRHSTAVAVSIASDPARRADIVAHVRDVLGDTITAVIAGANDVKTVVGWAEGHAIPAERAWHSLWWTYQTLRVLEPVVPRDVIQGWFIGMNPDLDDESPALTIADDPASVMDAAHNLVAHG